MKKICVFLLIVLMIISLTACKSDDYKEAMQLYVNNEYDAALVIFTELGDYEDSMNMVTRCRYAQAHSLLQDGKYEEARIMFEELGDYKDSANYAEGMGWYLFTTYVSEQGAVKPENLLFNHTGRITVDSDCLYVEIENSLFTAKAVIDRNSSKAELYATSTVKMGYYETIERGSTKWDISQYRKGDVVSWDEYDYYNSGRKANGTYAAMERIETLPGESGANLITALTDCIQQGIEESGLDVTMADLGFTNYGSH